MNLFKQLFSKKDSPINSYTDFWAWFVKNEKLFFNVVKEQQNIEKDFFDKLSPKLSEFISGILFVAGMYDENTAELVFTVDGDIKYIVFAEELAATAPQISGWKFTALKETFNLEELEIRMGAYYFNSESLGFYAETDEQYPDEIDIVLVYNNFKEEDKGLISNGAIIFLDNYLGELDAVVNIDSLSVIGPANATQEVIPIGKLKDYLNWRQKEFIEKYSGILSNTEESNYASLEAVLPNGNPLFAIINTDVLEWDNKASHPWILDIEIKYNGDGNNGLPDKDTYKLLDEIEDDIAAQLRDFEGYLNIGRETADGLRTIYFACKDFRKPSKVLYDVQTKYSNRLNVEYDIFKDKYWQTFNKYL